MSSASSRPTAIARLNFLTTAANDQWALNSNTLKTRKNNEGIEPIARTPKGVTMGRIDTASQAMCERLLDWCEEARCAGREYRAEALLLLAWRAYDRPPSRDKQRG